MPLRSLFNPTLYPSSSITTGLLCIRTTSNPGAFPALEVSPFKQFRESKRRIHVKTSPRGNGRRNRTTTSATTAIVASTNRRAHHTVSAGVAVDAPPGSDKPGLVTFAEIWKKLIGGSEATASGGGGAVALPMLDGGGAVWDTTTPPARACCPTHAPPLPANQDSAYWRNHSPSSPSSPLHQALVDHFHEIEQLYLGNVSYVHRMNSLNPGLLEGLAWKGQKPPFLLVDCSDSRVNEQGIFDAEPGTMFTAGNIANMFVEEDPSSCVSLYFSIAHPSIHTSSIGIQKRGPFIRSRHSQCQTRCRTRTLRLRRRHGVDGSPP